MEKGMANAGINAANQLLNSGYLVVTMATFIIIILVGIIIFLLRDNRKLTDTIIDNQSREFEMQEKIIVALKNQEKQIELLANFINGHHGP